MSASAGRSLFGSTGGCPPFGEASVRSTPASRKTKYGAANSSSQNPVLRPVSPRVSCEVSTISIFKIPLLSYPSNHRRPVQARIAGRRAGANKPAFHIHRACHALSDAGPELRAREISGVAFKSPVCHRSWRAIRGMLVRKAALTDMEAVPPCRGQGGAVSSTIRQAPSDPSTKTGLRQWMFHAGNLSGKTDVPNRIASWAPYPKRASLATPLSVHAGAWSRMPLRLQWQASRACPRLWLRGALLLAIGRAEPVTCLRAVLAGPPSRSQQAERDRLVNAWGPARSSQADDQHRGCYRTK